MSLRLLVVVNVYAPDLGGGVLFADLCEQLSEAGIEVTVRSAYPYYPEWHDKTGQNGLHIDVQQSGNLRHERYGLYIPSNPNSLWQRLVYEASFFASLLRRLPRRGSYDVMMVYCPLVGAVAFGALARWWARLPFWLNIQDLSADAAKASGIAGPGVVTRLMSWVQRSLFNRADVWSSISPVMIERLALLRKGDQPILLLPNWLHGSLSLALSQLPNKLGRPPATPPKLLYSGNIGTKQDLLLFCQSLARMEADFEFRIQGGGGRAEAVRQWVAAAGDPRFSFHPLSDEEGLAQALHAADYFVITERAGSGGSFIPSKLIPGLAAGTPILAVCDADSPLGREMAEAQPGPLMCWDDLEQIPALLSLDEAGMAQYRTWQANALTRARYYDRTVAIYRYRRALLSIAERRPMPPDPSLHAASLPAPTPSHGTES